MCRNGGNSPFSALRRTVRLHTPKICSNSGSRIKRSLNRSSVCISPSLLPLPGLRLLVPSQPLFQSLAIQLGLLAGQQPGQRFCHQVIHILLPVFPTQRFFIPYFPVALVLWIGVHKFFGFLGFLACFWLIRCRHWFQSFSLFHQARGFIHITRPALHL